MSYKVPNPLTSGDPVLHHYYYGTRELRDTFSVWSFIGIPNLMLALLCQMGVAGVFVAWAVDDESSLWLWPALFTGMATTQWVYCLLRRFRTVTCNFNGSMLLAHVSATGVWSLPLALSYWRGEVEGFGGVMLMAFIPALWLVLLWTGAWGMHRTISMAHPDEVCLHHHLSSMITEGRWTLGIRD